MKKTNRWIVAAAAVLLAAGVCFADERISQKDVPEAVRTACVKAYPTAKVDKWEKEKFEGKPVFVAETTDGKINRNVM